MDGPRRLTVDGGRDCCVYRMRMLKWMVERRRANTRGISNTSSQELITNRSKTFLQRESRIARTERSLQEVVLCSCCCCWLGRDKRRAGACEEISRCSPQSRGPSEALKVDFEYTKILCGNGTRLLWVDGCFVRCE